MATASEKLAASLEELMKYQTDDKMAVIQAKDISRTHRERLLKNGFIHEVIKGWYIETRPDDRVGDSTMWYTSFWVFCAKYCQTRFKDDWCLSPEQSLSLQSGDFSVPTQLIIRSPSAHNNTIKLLYDTALFDVKAAIPSKDQIAIVDGLRVYTIPDALLHSSPEYYRTNQVSVLSALSLVKGPSEILGPLLAGGHSVKAGRVAGAFRKAGRADFADEILATMRSADFDVREIDPFNQSTPSLLIESHETPYSNRIRLMWGKMRNDVIKQFQSPPDLPKEIKSYLKSIDEVYNKDAYHSLSIEGYSVSPELIDRVRSGEWNPDEEVEDKKEQDALAARGYWQSFQAVKIGIEKTLQGQNPGLVAKNDHSEWYRELFNPSVAVGILKPAGLAGYRRSQVFISKSRHVPPNRSYVYDCMQTLFALLKSETESSVRAVLGHFIFVYVHPYMDGNGRLARFLMNIMLASGGYPWTVILVEDRDEYMDSLEQASVEQNIIPFATFLAKLIKHNQEDNPH